MYGLEGILGNLVTSVATPAVGGIMGDIVGSKIEDELLKEITQTTVGALSGAAVGAGLGALTGGKSGALSGALTGGVGGGVGGYNAQDVSQMFGMGKQAPQTPDAATYGASPVANKTMPASMAGFYENDPSASLQDTDTAQPTTTPAPAPEYKGYLDFLKKNYEPLAGGFYLGSAYGANQDTEAQSKQNQQQNMLRALLEEQNARKFAQSIWGYADGGPVNVGLANPQVQVHFPAWAQEQIQREGGLAALQQGVKQGMAQGGYINLQPMGETAYPQALVPKAHPYPAASPQRREVVQMAHGGLIDGPGDGMSDSIPANIGGREPVKVADGEYVIPQNIAEKYGPDRLQAMMTKVRAAAHAKKGKQVVQDAGKKAFIKSLTGVRA